MNEMNMICPICGNPLFKRIETNHSRHIKSVDCPSCGEYAMSEMFYEDYIEQGKLIVETKEYLRKTKFSCPPCFCVKDPEEVNGYINITADMIPHNRLKPGLHRK